MKKLELKQVETLDYGRREAINSLKTNMQFAGVGVKTVLITSAGQREGKSTISFDLARSLAESGNKVVLVDADMRNSSFEARYRIENAGKKKKNGLTHYLSGQVKAEEIIYSSNIQGLHIVLSGPFSTNPTELLNGAGFERLIKKLANSYDFVIIDSPPLGAVIDVAIMAPHTDGVIIVLEANSTSTRAAQNVARQIKMSGARILGYVLNKAPARDGGYYSKYKYYGKK